MAFFWDDYEGWKWDVLRPLLPLDVAMVLAASAISYQDDWEDQRTWGLAQNGAYSVSSAYAIIHHTREYSWTDGPFFKAVWRLQASERTILKGGVLTNAERKRRHMAESDVCSLCHNKEETLTHLFKDCPPTKEIWWGFGEFWTASRCPGTREFGSSLWRLTHSYPTHSSPRACRRSNPSPAWYTSAKAFSDGIANTVAYSLSRVALDVPVGLRQLSIPLVGVDIVLLNDLGGKATPRCVKL
ncbi:hypothetical protein V2J09_004116 [Rumex salicifolius]